MNDSLISAALVYDGGADITIPNRLLPAGAVDLAINKVADAGQMQGGVFERLIELAGRACYDSLGKGRKSPEYHKHIIEVNHGSVWEHANITVEFTPAMGIHIAEFMGVLLNRPGVYVTFHTSGALRLTVNFRAIREWDSFSDGDIYPRESANKVGAALKTIGYRLAPLIFPDFADVSGPLGATLVSPVRDEECWVTMLLTGSRGFSHELVRHGDWTAISQRSTRYVDESAGEWVHHPLVEMFLADEENSFTNLVTFSPEAHELVRGKSLRGARDGLVHDARKLYDAFVVSLEKWLTLRGVDKLTARKQARGAARGYLGNALSTEVIFSANVKQWKRMLAQRANPAADAEIREVFCKAFGCLKASRYGDRFAGSELRPSPDGIGEVVVAVQQQ